MTSFGEKIPGEGIDECVALYTVDTDTGEATKLGETLTCDPGNGIAFNLSDVLYHLDLNYIQSYLNQTDGEATGPEPASGGGLADLFTPLMSLGMKEANPGSSSRPTTGASMPSRREYAMPAAWILLKNDGIR